MPNTVYTDTAALQGALLTDYADAYAKEVNNLPDWLPKVMDLGFQSKNREENRFYFGAAPVMKHRWTGDPINEANFDGFSFTTPNFDYDLRIPWHRNDRQDEKTGSLLGRAQEGGASAARIPYRAFWDLMSGSAATVPVVPNAPDGVAAFDTSTRFGVSGGNTEGSVTFSTGAGIRSGVWSGLERFYKMQDTEGQELHSAGVIESEVVFIYSADDSESVAEAFKQEMTKDRGAAAGVSNTLSASGVTFTLVNAGFRLASGTAYLVLANAKKKPVFMQTRTPLLASQSMSGDAGTQLTHDTGIEYVQWEQRLGFGVGLPYGAVKLSSS